MTQQDTERSVLAEAVLGMRRLRTELAQEKQLKRAPIAIVGMSCRMPGAADVSTFWELLHEGRSGISEIPDTRWDTAGFFAPELGQAGKTYTEHAGLLEDVSQFDAGFFGISPREAAALDPQQRLLLEVSWEAIEDAGIAPETLNGSSTGVFYGITNYDYVQTQLQHTDPAALEAYSLTSNASTFAAGRTSYWLGLNGPSLSVDTACSSSLVGLHLACQSLRAGECDAALAGGVNILLSPEWFVVLSQARMLSPAGACKTFDAAADGYVRSEGCGVVVLKRLADAEAAGDRILAVIRGSAVNQDGRSGGITVPNAVAQQAVIRSALEMADLKPAEVSYVEAHGTGTPLGDPIELRALDAVLGQRGEAGPLLVGSVKTNVGHLEPAAGMAGLIKVILALQHEQIPAHLHLNTINPDIGISELGLQITTEATAWPRSQTPRVAGVSSFGASGTNAHVLVSDAPVTSRTDQSEPDGVPHVLTLSAKRPAALQAMAANYAQLLESDERPPLADICYTANTGRAQFSDRLAVTAGSAAELARALRAHAAGLEDGAGAVHTGQVRPQTRSDVVFLFTGQGSQYPGMAVSLHKTEPVFRAHIEFFDELAGRLLGRSLLSILEPVAGDTELIHQTQYTQPALFAVEYALAQLWQHRGVKPAAVLGHSLGELVAASVAGIMTPEDGFTLAVARGELMHRFGLPAAMASVNANESLLTKLIEPVSDNASVAAVNGPESTTIAGSPAAVDAVLQECAARGVTTKRLPVERGFHSPMIEPALEHLERAAASLTFSDAVIPLISNVTGEVISTLTPGYLRSHARQPVRFLAGISTLLAQGHRTFLEIGPTPSLTTLTRSIAAEHEVDITALASLRPRRDDATMLAEAAARLWTAGVAIDWAALQGPGARRISLPSYPFDRQRHWFEGAGKVRPNKHMEAIPAAVTAPGEPSSRLLGTRLSAPLDLVQYEAILDSRAHDCLADCVLDGVPVVNIGVYLDAVLNAWAELAPDRAGALVTDLVVLQSLISRQGESQRVQLVLTVPSDQPTPFGYFSEQVDEHRQPYWREHLRGLVSALPPAPNTPPWQRDAVLKTMTEQQSGEDFYRAMWRRNLLLGPSARWVEQLWLGRQSAVARMRAPHDAELATYLLPPGLSDALFQTLFSCLPVDIATDATFMIVGMDRLVFHARVPAGAASYCHTKLVQVSEDRSMLAAEVDLYDEDGRLLVQAHGVSLRRAVREQLTAAAPATEPSQVSASFSARDLSAPAATVTDAAGPAVATMDADAAREVVLSVVARVLGAQQADLIHDEPLQNLGLDSLMALEIKSALASRLGISLPLITFLQARDLAQVQDLVVAELGAAVAETKSEALRPDPAGRYEPFELTDLQQAYLIGRSGAFELGKTSTYFFVEVDVTGIDLARLEQGLRHAIQRHDMLRAVMTADGRQRVLAEVPEYRIRVESLIGTDHAATQSRLAEITAELKAQVLDPYVWPLFDVRATRMDEEWTRLHLGFDALIIDAWSTMLLFREWADSYRGLEPEQPLTLTFRDYTRGIRASAGSEPYAQALSYWMDRVDSLPAAPELPVAVDPSQLPQTDFTHRSIWLSPAEWKGLTAAAAALAVTPSALLCTAYAQILASWSTSTDFTLNLLFFNRQPLHAEVDQVIGNFSATTLLEVHSPAHETFAVRAARLQRQLWQDLEHSAVSGVQVLRELNRRNGSTGRASMPVVFASTINFGARSDSSQFSGLSQHLAGLGESGREVSSSIRTPQVWLDHQVVEDRGGLSLNWDSVDAIFPAGMIDAMFGAYGELVRELASDPANLDRPAAVAASPAELQLRAEINRTETPREPELLHDRFLRFAATQPDRCAVVSVHRTLTYGELDHASDAVAAWLAAAKTAGGSLVGVVMRKGWEQVAAVIGILKAGCAYVPIDAELPPSRLALVLGSASITAVLTQTEAEQAMQWPESVQRYVLDDKVFDQPRSPAPARSAAQPHDLAYVIYTSGSTGMPKGVMIEHAGAVNTILDINERFEVGAEDRALGLSALNFDLSVYDIFGMLSAGGAIVLPAADDHREPGRWVELVREHGVTIWNSVPALMDMFTESALGSLADVSSIRTVMMSGDWIPVRLPDRISTLLPSARQYSLGGATEASIWSIIYPIEGVDPDWVSIPYGLPMRNQRFQVLNSSLQPCPTWVTGDLYIGGAGLARGYLGDDLKTRRSFISHPITGERLYRTGDQGRYRPDGVIEFLGRTDSQVKVQGYRVELGEIEAALLRCPGVTAAVAAAAGPKTGAKRLVAYVVSDPGCALDPAAVLAELRDSLPQYCVPQVILPLSRLPLSANGKVDRSALPTPEQLLAGASADVAPPRTETERWLQSVWEQFFPGQSVGVRQSFFDLGGNSLDAVRLMARLHEQTGRSLPLGTLFAHPTISGVAAALADEGVREHSSLVPIRISGSATPLILIHPVGGDVLCYADLVSSLDPTRPVYGVQAPAADATDARTLVELAAGYAADIRAQLPDGRCRLGGWSMGGVLALEVAGQLLDSGFLVEQVICIDMSEPPGPASAELDQAQLLAWFSRDLAGLSGQEDLPSAAQFRESGEAGCQLLLDWAHASGVLSPDINLATIESIFSRFSRNLLALLDHRPRPYSGATRLLFAAGNPDGGREVSESWMALLSGDTRMIALPGTHYSIMRAPHISELVAQIETALAE